MGRSAAQIAAYNPFYGARTILEFSPLRCLSIQDSVLLSNMHHSLHFISSPSLHMPLPPPPLPYDACRRRRSAISASAQPPAGNATMYDLLSVEDTAPPQEIRAAYRTQARRWHPDACLASGDKGLFAQQFMRVKKKKTTCLLTTLRRRLWRNFLVEEPPSEEVASTTA